MIGVYLPFFKNVVIQLIIISSKNVTSLLLFFFNNYKIELKLV